MYDLVEAAASTRLRVRGNRSGRRPLGKLCRPDAGRILVIIVVSLAPLLDPSDDGDASSMTSIAYISKTRGADLEKGHVGSYGLSLLLFYNTLRLVSHRLLAVVDPFRKVRSGLLLRCVKVLVIIYIGTL